MLKHVGQVTNTGRRCVVVFREIYDEKGNVLEKDNCLVVETDTLPDMQHQDLMRIVESEPAQRTGEIFNVLARERFGDGNIALTWLHQSGRLRKYPTSQIMMTPSAGTSVRLDKLNTIIRMQKDGRSQAEIENAVRDDTDQPPRQAVTGTRTEAAAPADTAIMNDADIAEQRLKQAEFYAQESERLRQEAYALNPKLKSKRRVKA
jgi:hypothetical protein